MQLNIEQRKIINSKPTGNALIKGVAGSGKTTVSIYRIPFLLNHYCYEKDDAILMLTFNRTLSNYIRYQYEKIDEEEKIDFLSLIRGGEDKVNIETVDSLIFKYFCKYKNKHNLKLDITTDKNLKYQLIQDVIYNLKKEFPDAHLLETKYSSFLLDEIDWIKSCNFLELEEYQNADRLGRMNKNNSDGGPQKIQKNSNTRSAIFSLMQILNRKLEEKGLIDIKDAAILALREAKENTEKKYSHIIIDESQDLTRVQLDFISCLYLLKSYSSITFVCDTAQSIYPHSWLVKGRSFTSIGYDMTGKSSSLSKNYRTTTQISQAAYSLIKNDHVILEDDNFVVPSLIDRQGSYPVYRAFSNMDEEADYVASEIKNFLIGQYEIKDIAIIAKTKGQLSAIKECLDKRNISSTQIDNKNLDFDEQALKLLTMHSIKGLEFKVVFIIGLNQGIIPYTTYKELEEHNIQITTDRKLLYVGMTRANELLYITSSNTPSQFIYEINARMLKFSNRSLLHSYYPINIDDYYFTNKISNVFSNEEKIRQWFIKELEATYKYPKKLIDVEYPVNFFSKYGAVDIVVFRFNNKENKIPLIFIEVKAYGADIKNGIAQLKSYMSNEKTCSYGIVTNGIEMVVFNSDFEYMDDIPFFSTHMLPSSIERFEYIDIKHNKNYIIERDNKDKEEIEITDQHQSYCLSSNNTREIKVYGSIAAGQPIHMNPYIEDTFYLPDDWYNTNDDIFMLKVRGDSMIDAKIDDGDYVLINKQENANVKDIVAVSLDDDATLKRYMKMGDAVLLVPENKNYEPISISSEQAHIIGVAYGIIKRFSE